MVFADVFNGLLDFENGRLATLPAFDCQNLCLLNGLVAIFTKAFAGCIGVKVAGEDVTMALIKYD